MIDVKYVFNKKILNFLIITNISIFGAAFASTPTDIGFNLGINRIDGDTTIPSEPILDVSVTRADIKLEPYVNADKPDVKGAYEGLGAIDVTNNSVCDISMYFRPGTISSNANSPIEYVHLLDTYIITNDTTIPVDKNIAHVRYEFTKSTASLSSIQVEPNGTINNVWTGRYQTSTKLEGTNVSTTILNNSTLSIPITTQFRVCQNETVKDISIESTLGMVIEAK